MRKMNITVIGAGNVGTFISGEFTRKGHDVTIYTRDVSKWCNSIYVNDLDSGEVYCYSPYNITSNLEVAVSNADLIIFSLPTFAIKKIIDECTSFINAGTYIGFYPGLGGIEFACKPLLDKGCVIFGTQRISSVVRLKKYGESVITSGKRKELFLGCIPKKYRNVVADMMADLLSIDVFCLPNYLSVTLTPSNPLLHPTRLYTIFKDYKDGVIYDNIPLFYEDWDMESSDNLIRCNDELEMVIDKINLDLTYIRPLLEHYESNNLEELTNKIRSIKSFKGILTPSVKVDKGFIPDVSNRYFSADFPYGLILIKAFAIICGVNTERIDSIIDWYQNLVDKKYIDLNNNTFTDDSYELFIPQLYGVNTVDDIERFYNAI